MGPNITVDRAGAAVAFAKRERMRFLPLNFRSYISLHVSCAHLLVDAQHQLVLAFAIVEPRHAPAQMDQESGAVFKFVKLNRLDPLS